jgi:hypothetical protein
MDYHQSKEFLMTIGTLAALNVDDPTTHEHSAPTAETWEEPSNEEKATQDNWFVEFDDHEQDDAVGTTSWHGGW